MKEESWQCRTELLLGKDQTKHLENAHVLIAGLGGVGGYAAEQLCRAGIGKLTLVDCDVVQASNRNRQLIALSSTEGLRKTQLFAARLKDINPACEIITVDDFLDETNIGSLLDQGFDYLMDAIDTLAPKVILLTKAVERGKRIISSMGSGGKTDPTKIEISDIADSHHCKLAYKVRKAIHAKEIRTGIKVVYSSEPVSKSAIIDIKAQKSRRSVLGTISYMPAIFGCFCAAEIIKDLLEPKASSGEYL